MRRAALLVLFSTPLLPHCMPDFEALSASAGSDGAGQAGDAGSPTGSAGETAANGGAASGLGGSSSGANLGGALSDLAGAGGTDAQGGGAMGGAGGESGCRPSPAAAIAYTGFDQGLSGMDFLEAWSTASVDTTRAATGSSAWDAEKGNSCPGALRFSFAFKAYVADATPDEAGYGTFGFAPMDWSRASTLHAMVKVAPVKAPITGVRLFVLSGTDYLYDSVFDATAFKTGQWNEMVLEPSAGPYYDPTNVSRIGVEVRLLRGGTAGLPVEIPQVDVWLDDIWLEPQ